MKKLSYLLICLFLAVGFAACSDDADEITMEGYLIQKGDQTTYVNTPVKLEFKVEKAACDVTYEWTVNGELKGKESTFIFKEDKKGEYQVSVKADDGVTQITENIKVLVLNLPAAAKAVKSVEDIEFWIGEGENKSMLGIQWVIGQIEEPTKENTHFLCWGYRWKKGEKPNGDKLLEAIAAADPRLFFAFGPGFKGIKGKTIRGLGYDANGDGKFAIKNIKTNEIIDMKDFKDGQIDFSELGVTGDEYVSVDPEDYWEGGWEKKYASYYNGDSNDNELPTYFSYGNLTASNRMLYNDSWDVWTFSSINDAQYNIEPIPELMVAAPKAN